MKKSFALALACLLALCLFACGGNGAADQTTAPQGETTEPEIVLPEPGTPTITPAKGWKEAPEEGSVGYMSDIAYINLFAEPIHPDIEDYPAWARERYVKFYADGVGSELRKTTVNGMEASEFTVTSEALNQTFRVLYICKDGCAYRLVCTAATPDFSKAKADFQSMIDSFTIK